MELLIFYLVLAVGMSFLCSLLESVILSSSPAYVAVQKKQGKPFAKILAHQKEHIDRPLAAILTLNTIAHTVGAAGVGAQVLRIWGEPAVAMGSGILTFVILVFSEIIPKTLGAVHWKKLSAFCAYTVRALIVVTYPFVWLSEKIHDLIDSEGKSRVTTREEMIVTAEMGADEGSIRPKESAVIRNLLMLDKITVADIMTPSSVIFGLDATTTIGQVFREHKMIRFSRIPIYTENMDKIDGIVHRYKLMEAYNQDLDDMPVSKFSTQIHAIPEDVPVSAALDQFIKRKEHIFLVVGEYGTTEGLVSLEDVIETLLGVEIVDEFDSVEDMRKYARELWEARKQQRPYVAPKVHATDVK